MANAETLAEYANAIKNLKTQCVAGGLTEEEFKELYFESLNSLEMPEHSDRTNFRRCFNKYRTVIIAVIVFVCVVLNFKTIYSCIVCNLQEYIYPGLRLLRRLSIPVISLFPALTDFYHETCLIQNPFFTVVDMDCWPCSSVSSIREVSDPKPVNQQQSAPFIYETEQQTITTQELNMFYLKNKIMLDNESPKILMNNKQYISLSDMFSQQMLHDKNFYIWKFSNMNMAKLLRQIIPRPKVVPKFGQSTERFVIMDTSQQAFSLPDTDCSFSFVLSLSGSRVIDLVPAEECKHQCKILKIELKETYLLWYNWWYWRPVVQSSMSNGTFIAHVGSYC